MDIRAILLLGSEAAPAEHWVEQPIAALELLGHPIVEHAIERLVRHGVDRVTVIKPSAVPYQPTPALSRLVSVLNATPNEVWRAAESAFNRHAGAGARLIAVQRLGPYIDVDLDQVVRFHADVQNRVTRLTDEQRNPLDFALIDATRRNDAAFLLRSALRETRVPSCDYEFCGYSNPLREIADYRCLAQDALMQDCELVPAGQEIKPGVWAAATANIDRAARVVAPAFIGQAAKIRAGAVVTRMSNVERDSVVDYGTLIENASLLPLTYVGVSLDVAHSVIGFGRVANLKRDVTVPISDAGITGQRSPSPLVRRLGEYATVVGRVTTAVLASLPSKRKEPEPALPVRAKTKAAVR
jgi:hypothetical protein